MNLPQIYLKNRLDPGLVTEFLQSSRYLSEGQIQSVQLSAGLLGMDGLPLCPLLLAACTLAGWTVVFHYPRLSQSPMSTALERSSGHSPNRSSLSSQLHAGLSRHRLGRCLDCLKDVSPFKMHSLPSGKSQHSNRNRSVLAQRYVNTRASAARQRLIRGLEQDTE